MRRTTAVLVVALVVLAVGCGDDRQQGAVDAGASADAAVDDSGSLEAGEVVVTAYVGAWITDPDQRSASLLAIYEDGGSVRFDAAEGPEHAVPVVRDGAALDQLWAFDGGTGTRAIVGLADAPNSIGSEIDLSYVDMGPNPVRISGELVVSNPEEGFRILGIWPGSYRFDSATNEFTAVIPDGAPSIQLNAIMQSEASVQLITGVLTVETEALGMVSMEIPINETSTDMRIEFDAPPEVEPEAHTYRWNEVDLGDADAVLLTASIPSGYGIANHMNFWTTLRYDESERAGSAEIFLSEMPDSAPPLELTVVAHDDRVGMDSVLERGLDGLAAEFVPMVSSTLAPGSLRDGRSISAELPEHAGAETRVLLRDGIVHIGMITLANGRLSGIPAVVADAVPSLVDANRASVAVCVPHEVHPAACAHYTSTRDITVLDGIVPLPSE